MKWTLAIIREFMDIKDVLVPCLDFQAIKPKLGSQKRENKVEGKSEKTAQDLNRFMPISHKSRFSNPKYES